MGDKSKRFLIAILRFHGDVLLTTPMISEIKRIFGEVERKEGIEILEIPFKKGDTIKVIAGPFIDFTGTVENVNEDKQKVKVMVSIFGRPTPIELDFFQVELEK